MLTHCFRPRVFACCLFVVSAVPAVRADEQVRSAQEELRRRNIYFGEIDGRQSGELEEALKRYQKRKGLAATGSSDRDTLRSLGIVTRAPGEAPPKELELPDEPVLKSDVKIDAGEEAREIAAQSGVSTASIAPGKPLVAQPKRAMHLAAMGRSRSTEAVGTSGVGRFSTHNSARLESEIQQYVSDYLKAVSRNRLEDELRFYADRVDYLNSGWVDRRIIENSLRKYYQHWPSRGYGQVAGIQYRTDAGHGQIVVNFRSTFNVRNGGKRAKGQTDNQMVINAATADPRIVSISEKRVRL